MRSYQSVLILKPDLDEAQVDQVLEKITEFLSKNNGSIVKVEKWGKKRLAYRVKRVASVIISISTIRVRVWKFLPLKQITSCTILSLNFL